VNAVQARAAIPPAKSSHGCWPQWFRISGNSTVADGRLMKISADSTVAEWLALQLPAGELCVKHQGELYVTDIVDS
jgi:hypothetical protein